MLRSLLLGFLMKKEERFPKKALLLATEAVSPPESGRQPPGGLKRLAPVLVPFLELKQGLQTPGALVKGLVGHRVIHIGGLSRDGSTQSWILICQGGLALRWPRGMSAAITRLQGN